MSSPLLRSAARLVRQSAAHAQGLASLIGGVPAGVRVSYGQPIPLPSETAVGGIVKLQELSASFPESGARFNTLYLVSSRLPPAAVVRADWARRKGARFVLNQNGVAYPAWHGPGWERFNRECTALLSRADHVFYQSEFCRISADRFAGPARGTWEVLHNAVDTRRFTPGPPSGPRALTLLLAGSQDQWYRLDSAVRTLALLVESGVDAELLVTGRLWWTRDAAANRRQAEALVDEVRMTSRVSFLGAYTQAEAPAIFRRAHIVLHTKYNDPCPSAVLEALACGRPVVYSKSGGVPELVGDQAGIGVEAELSWERDVPPDPHALAAAVKEVRSSLSTFAAAARARAVERFDIQHWLHRHRRVFERLAA
ncbi:MAG: glycosyltransferase family 4 protein [Vicinamibacterales bacterium]